MVLGFYGLTFFLALVLMVVYIMRWNRSYDVWFTVLFVLVPIINMGYLILASASTVEGAWIGNLLTYIGGCFLQLTIFFLVLSLCKIKARKLSMLVAFAINTSIYLVLLTTKSTKLFYKALDIRQDNGATYLIKEYGPVHTFFYIMIVFYSIAGPVALFYAYLKKKKDVSVKTISLLSSIIILNLLTFFGGRLVTKDVELVPLTYDITMIVCLVIGQKLSLYSIETTVSDLLIRTNNVGYFSFDKNRKYIISNQIASVYLPELTKLRVDHKVEVLSGILPELNSWMDEADERGAIIQHDINRISNIYRVMVEKNVVNGHDMGYIFTVYDITFAMQHQEHLEMHAKQMQVLKEDADVANRAKSNFLASMSHEIRTPINAVLGMDQMILDECKDENILAYARDIRLAGNTLLELIGEILDFSKIESGQMVIVDSDYLLSDLIHEIDILIRPRAEAKNLKLSFDIDDSIPYILHGDDVRVKQMIVNLLSNAVKYTEQGSVTLEIKKKRAAFGKVMLYIAVVDTGMGIKEEDQAKLFEQFMRVDESHTRNIEGTGLGLAITARMAELMGSRVKVESTYGAGSTFYMDLEQGVVNTKSLKDYLKEKGDANNANDVVESNNGVFIAPNAKVLIVDDTLLNRKVFIGLLRSTEVQIDQADNGAKALEMMTQNHYDIIFMDHLMPDLDGIETLHASYELENNKCKETPVIALTANAITGVQDMYISAGFDDYLSKPVKKEVLCDTLLKYLNPELISTL